MESREIDQRLGSASDDYLFNDDQDDISTIDSIVSGNKSLRY
jgi:hypothetical protein